MLSSFSEPLGTKQLKSRKLSPHCRGGKGFFKLGGGGGKRFFKEGGGGANHFLSYNFEDVRPFFAKKRQYT